MLSLQYVALYKDQSKLVAANNDVVSRIFTIYRLFSQYLSGKWIHHDWAITPLRHGNECNVDTVPIAYNQLAITLKYHIIYYI